MLPLRCPRCPEHCLNRGADICHTIDCEVNKSQKEWYKARTAERRKRVDIEVYFIRSAMRHNAMAR